MVGPKYCATVFVLFRGCATASTVTFSGTGGNSERFGERLCVTITCSINKEERVWLHGCREWLNCGVIVVVSCRADNHKDPAVEKKGVERTICGVQDIRHTTSGRGLAVKGDDGLEGVRQRRYRNWRRGHPVSQLEWQGMSTHRMTEYSRGVVLRRMASSRHLKE